MILMMMIIIAHIWMVNRKRSYDIGEIHPWDQLIKNLQTQDWYNRDILENEKNTISIF